MQKQINIDGEIINLKKDRFGWAIVYPLKKDITKPFYIQEEKKWNINFKNLLLGGSWFNLIKTLLIIGIILLVMYSYKHDMSVCIQYANEQFIKNMTNFIQ